MALTYAANGDVIVDSTWEIAEAFEARLKASMAGTAGGSKPAVGYVRITTPPNEEDGGAYKAEEGLHIVVGDPQPVDKDGAGRAGQRTRIAFQVWVVTRSNQDRAGDVRIAVRKHLNVQDALFNALHDTPPNGVPAGAHNQIGIYAHWIPGGAEIRSKAKISPDTFASVHLFEVRFVQKLQVVRSEF
jgi:hypothetical protein